MDYKAPVENYTGKIAEVIIGKGEKAIKKGIEWVREPYKDVLSDPVAWARKSLDYGADLICIRLENSDPAGVNVTADCAAATVKKVVDSINSPVVVYGSGDEAKDVQVLTRVAEVCSGEKLLLGPVVKENFEPISKAALDHGHSIIAQTPLDINLEKELNVKLLKTFPADRIVVDPLTSALGYGMEYSFTIMERTKHIGIMFGDKTMQMPIIADLGGECWKTKQAKESKQQGILWESITALTLLLAGANLLVLRHPESCRYMKEVLEGRL
jgi:acetyl-CoA decarbonylase/synthase complex subunit delta